MTAKGRHERTEEQLADAQHLYNNSIFPPEWTREKKLVVTAEKQCGSAHFGFS